MENLEKPETQDKQGEEKQKQKHNTICAKTKCCSTKYITLNI